MREFAVNGCWSDAGEHLGYAQGFQFGAGLFETIRIQNKRSLLWDAHMARLHRSALTLNLAVGLDIGVIEKWTADLVQEQPMTDCALKILWTVVGGKGCVFFYFRELPYTALQRTAGLKVCFGSIRRDPGSRIVGHKTLNYLDNLLERQAAAAEGWDEALLLNARGELAEGTATNVFMLSEGQMVTPPLDAGLLPGVQRQAVLDACREAGIEAVETVILPERLKGADGVFLTNALMGLMPVSNLQGSWYDRNEGLVARINSATGIVDRC